MQLYLYYILRTKYTTLPFSFIPLIHVNSNRFMNALNCIRLFRTRTLRTEAPRTPLSIVQFTEYVDTGIPLALDPVGEPTGKHPHPRLD